MSSALAGLKDLFSNTKGTFGLDIGLSAIKVCQLSKIKKGKYRLDKFASIPLSEATLIDDEIQKPDEVMDAIEQAVESAGIKSKGVCLGLFGPNTVTKRMQVPSGSKDEVEDNVLWESEQYIPFPADEAEIDFTVLNDDKENVDAIVAAAQMDMVESYQNLVKEAGYSTKLVDLNVFALSNLFEVCLGDNFDQVNEGSILIDFGAQTTKVVVFKDNGPVLTKEINVGGVLVTEEIQRQMGLSYAEAEDLKTMGDDSGNLPEDVVKIIEDQIALQLQELKKVLNFYISSGSSEQAKYCFITGGSSRLPGLEEALKNVVDMDVMHLDPWAKIEINKKAFSDEELEMIADIGCVAMGLAMRQA